MKNKVQVIATPFKHHDYVVKLFKLGNTVWFESPYLTLNTFPREWIVWAAEKLSSEEFK